MERLVRQSSEMWVVYAGDMPLIFLGVIPYTLLGQSHYLWTMPFTTLKVEHLKDMRKLLERNMGRFRTLTAKVAQSLSKAERFAEFFGFHKSYPDGPFNVYVRWNR